MRKEQKKCFDPWKGYRFYRVPCQVVLMVEEGTTVDEIRSTAHRLLNTSGDSLHYVSGAPVPLKLDEAVLASRSSRGKRRV